MRTSQRGINLIKEFEGLKLTAYACPAGVATIGFGNTGSVTMADVRAQKRITLEEAERLLADDLQTFERGVLRGCTVQPNQNQFDAFVSLAYNIGLGAFARSTALRRHNAGDFDAAANAIEMWNKATVNGQRKVLRGLTRRRAAEKALYLLPVEPAEVDEMVQAVVEESTLASSRTIQGGAVAGGATVAAVIADTTEQVRLLTFLPPDTLQYLLAGLALMGIGAVLYARWDDWRKGRR